VKQAHLPVGEVITNIDLARDLGEHHIEELRTLFRERHLLVFPGQRLTVEDQIRVCGWFGPVAKGLDGKEHAYISNVHPSGLAGDAQLTFHSDYVNTPSPLRGISLYGDHVEGPSVPTQFISGARGLSALSPEFADRVRGLLALHFSPPGTGRPARTFELSDDASRVDLPRTVHPVVLNDPTSGADVILVNPRHTSRIIGLDREDSDAVLDELFSVLYDVGDDDMYIHHWSKGDLVVWNNIVVQHGRPKVAESAERTLRRVVISPCSERYALLAASV
jgi:taurine dioxygenase